MVCVGHCASYEAALLQRDRPHADRTAVEKRASQVYSFIGLPCWDVRKLLMGQQRFESTGRPQRDHSWCTAEKEEAKRNDFALCAAVGFTCVIAGPTHLPCTTRTLASGVSLDRNGRKHQSKRKLKLLFVGQWRLRSVMSVCSHHHQSHQLICQPRDHQLRNHTGR